jgi:hypothetical protein
MLPKDVTAHVLVFTAMVAHVAAHLSMEQL